MPTINTDHLMLPPKAMLRYSLRSFCSRRACLTFFTCSIELTENTVNEKFCAKKTDSFKAIVESLSITGTYLPFGFILILATN
jgi:hypothetical protein